MEDENRKKFKVNYKLFITSLCEILDCCNECINKVINSDTKIEEKTKNKLEKLNESCKILKDNVKELNEESYLSCTTLIRKLYKNIAQNLSKIYPEKKKELFCMRNEEKKKITIIDGIDIELIIGYFGEDELKYFWNHIDMMFITSVKMYGIETGKISGKAWDISEEMQKIIANNGGVIYKKSIQYNPFFGLVADNSELNIEEFKLQLEKEEISSSKTGEINIDKLLSYVGIESKEIDNMFNSITTENTEIAKQKINELLNVDNEEVKDIFGKIIDTSVGALKQNGIKGITKTIDTLTSSGVVSKKNIEKTMPYIKNIDSDKLLKELPAPTDEKQKKLHNTVKNMMNIMSGNKKRR